MMPDEPTVVVDVAVAVVAANTGVVTMIRSPHNQLRCQSYLMYLSLRPRRHPSVHRQLPTNHLHVWLEFVVASAAADVASQLQVLSPLPTTSLRKVNGVVPVSLITPVRSST